MTLWIIVRPVSYTHLDVYKRQTLFSAGYGFDRKTLTTKPVIFPNESYATSFPLHQTTYKENEMCIRDRLMCEPAVLLHAGTSDFASPEAMGWFRKKKKSETKDSVNSLSLTYVNKYQPPVCSTSIER